jgi:hypothetical protein
MKPLPILGYVILILASAFVPYTVISLLTWDINLGNWNLWWRLLLIVWSLAIANAVINKINNN